MVGISSLMQQRVKAASSAEHMKSLAVESSNADSQFQQLDKLRMVFEEYAKIGKESIPLAEKNLTELNEEFDQKNQSLDDVILLQCSVCLLNNYQYLLHCFYMVPCLNITRSFRNCATCFWWINSNKILQVRFSDESQRCSGNSFPLYLE